jgi:hypothetical protein
MPSGRLLVAPHRDLYVQMLYASTRKIFLSGINMMSTIYRKATNVTVWLGPDKHNDAPILFEEFKVLIEGCGRILEASSQFGHVDDETGDLH